MLKALMGLGKRSRSTPLLAALRVSYIKDIVNRDTLSLYRRIFNISSPVRDLQTFFLSQYIVHGYTTRGTLVHRIANIDPSLLGAGFSTVKHITIPVSSRTQPEAGIVDSLRFLLGHPEYNNPHGILRKMAQSLISVF